MFILDAAVHAAYQLVSDLAAALHPLAGSASTAAAIVIFTMGVRLLLVPLTVRQMRAERSRARLLPRITEIRRRHAADPRRQQRELAELYRTAGATPLAGCLPAVAQWPFFMVMYRLFVSASIAGHPNALLSASLLGAPLGEHLAGVVTVYGPLAPPTLVFLGLLASIGAVAWWSSRRMRDALAGAAPDGPPGGMPGWVPRLLPYGTVVFAAFVPLAAGVYLLTTTAWTAAERALLRRNPEPTA